MSRRSVVVIAAVLALVACRGEKRITGSYGSNVVSGQVTVSGLPDNSPAGVQVSVRGTGMTTTLAANGTFTFAEVPDGAELTFRRADGIDSSLAIAQGATFLNIQLTPNGASSSKRRSSRPGEPVFEFEGLVRSASATQLVVFTSHQEEVTFVLNASTVVRKGNTAIDPATLAADTRVHVKATKKDDVLTAMQVLVQNEAGQDDGEHQGDRDAKEFEGTVRSATASQLVILDSHRTEVTFVLNADTVIRKGNTTIAATDLKEGDRVHVKAATATDGTKTAKEVILQKTGH